MVTGPALSSDPAASADRAVRSTEMRPRIPRAHLAGTVDLMIWVCQHSVSRPPPEYEHRSITLPARFFSTASSRLLSQT